MLRYVAFLIMQYWIEEGMFPDRGNWGFPGSEWLLQLAYTELPRRCLVSSVLRGRTKTLLYLFYCFCFEFKDLSPDINLRSLPVPVIVIAW
jgi:hypothetical protein